MRSFNRNEQIRGEKSESENQKEKKNGTNILIAQSTNVKWKYSAT